MISAINQDKKMTRVSGKRLVRVADWLDHLITAAFYYVMTVQGMQTVYIMNSIDAARQGL